MSKTLKIANAQAFWGDSNEAAANLLLQQPDLNYITLDYLSEVSLSIMAIQRSKDPSLGYAADFIDVVKSLIPFWQKGSKVKLVTNAGGLEPKRCAIACEKVLIAGGCFDKKIGIVSGDNVLNEIQTDPLNPSYNNLETGKPITTILRDLETANAYLGARPLAEAIALGADIVISGRVADPSLTVAPCAAHFNWPWDAFDHLAQATLAGHLIECGTQVTGGISNSWMEMPRLSEIGYPIVEVDEDGGFLITKPTNSGGRVSLETVKEQMLYEIGDPDAYLSPDVTLSLLSVILKQLGSNAVRVEGAVGRPPPSSYKVSATYRDGFKAEGTLSIYGKQSKEKAYRCGEVILDRVRQRGYQLERSYIECLGGGDLVPGATPFIQRPEPVECVLRICVADRNKDAVEYFTKQIAPLVTCGPAGTTGYTSGRPQIRPVFGYWPCKIERPLVKPNIEIIEVV